MYHETGVMRYQHEIDSNIYLTDIYWKYSSIVSMTLVLNLLCRSHDQALD